MLFYNLHCKSHLSQTPTTEKLAPTSTFGPGPEWRPGGSSSSIQRSSEQNADLVLSVRVQVADLVRGLVHRLQVIHGARYSAVLHLPVDNGTVPIYAVSIQLDPEVGSADCC